MAPKHEISLDEIVPTKEIYTRWAVRADIPSIARILWTNFMSFEFHDHFCPLRQGRKEEFYLFVLARVRMFFVRPTVRFMVAEKLEVGVKGQTAEILGFSAWDAQGSGNSIGEEWRREREGWWSAVERKLVDVENGYHRYVRNTVFNYALFQQAWGRLHAAYGGDERYENNLHLQFLMVKPEWQRGYGLGHRLMQWGLDVADKVKLPVVIESSLAGYPFYLRHGCKLLTMVRIDFVPEKAYDMPVVVYDPR